MARSGFQATIGQSLGEGQYVVTAATNTGHVSVTYDTSAVTSLNQLKRAFERILLAAASAGMV